MITYEEYERKVYKWLKTKREKDNTFNFSVRVKGSKGAETDCFIGTKKSNYFATTFWTIPVGFPGSSGELISLVFGSKDKYYGYFFEFNQTKAPHDSQNQSALNLVEAIRDSPIAKLGFSHIGKPTNKMFNLKTKHRQESYVSLEAMLSDIEKDLEVIIPVVDSTIAAIKKDKPDFVAHRITEDEFHTMQNKLEKRFAKYKNISSENQLLSLTAEEPTEDYNEPENTKIGFPLNQILYGPPGTGKTYATKERAVAIASPDFKPKDFSSEKDYRKLIVAEYDKLYKDKSIHFTTFHQSLGYEDFIEGIKPKLINSGDSAQELSYNLEAGIFKRCCAYAAYNCYRLLKQDKKKSVESDYDFDELYEAFISQYRNVEEKPLFKTMTGRSVEIFEINKNDSIRARANGSTSIHVAPLTKENIQKLYDTFKSINDISNLQEVKDTVGVSPRITEFYAIFRGLKEFEAKRFRPIEKEQLNEADLNTEDEDEILKKFDGGVYDKAMKEYGKKAKPVVLIIDEINRGNVSAIFGELITLLEMDKRIGETEELQVQLAYSKSSFGVPQNLYVIGTMNTADRSVEALDTALRRRFAFDEIIPNPNLLKPQRMFWQLLWEHEENAWNSTVYKTKERQFLSFVGASEMLYEQRKAIWARMFKEGMHENQVSYFEEFDFTGIRLDSILTTINKRIDYLLDQDHTIGHSYFFEVYHSEDMQLKLREVFQYKIIPLLQEYFYNDYAKIGLVLGDEFIETETNDSQDIFSKSTRFTIADVATRYRLKPFNSIDFDAAIQELMGNE
ncbi:5-methylcytosine-specific restriction endonuclease McrBC GTP-binding regulatory subunit McrB [Leeuwenhoekiella aestuarii]|uniref:AAA family ATPase n=1 Tax=Leeuwenhoekiella aestuarii TaxID=2249426 RepID=UPI0010282696|nr:AAA family ATPase [Leeuwenhoekiella aestuarii]RXG15008.1 5-methylcytosine-specific restriction endonuclease McrBC GTP-binding regulatory subunit McrB [Leeuwenhoekiella aestuarii]